MASEVYVQLKTAWREKLLVSGTYHEKAREFRVRKLGWTEGRERCLAWRCFEVAEPSGVAVGGEAPDLDLDRAGKPPVCVEVVDED